MGGQIQWSVEELSASLRERAPEIEAARIDAAVSRALGPRGDREALAEIEAEVERLRVAERWAALRGRCAAISAIISRLRAEAATPYRRDVPPLTDDLAALVALYSEAAEGSA